MPDPHLYTMRPFEDCHDTPHQRMGGRSDYNWRFDRAPYIIVERLSCGCVYIRPYSTGDDDGTTMIIARHWLVPLEVDPFNV